MWIHRRHEAGEEVIAGLKGGAAESKVQDTGVEVLSQGVPGADGRTSVEHRRAISVDAALAGSLEHLNFRLIPLHSYSVSDQRRAAKRSFDEMRRSRGTEPTYFGMSAMLFTCAWPRMDWRALRFRSTLPEFCWVRPVFLGCHFVLFDADR